MIGQSDCQYVYAYLRVSLGIQKLKYLTVDFIITSKIKNVQVYWILLMKINGVNLFKYIMKFFYVSLTLISDYN